MGPTYWLKRFALALAVTAPTLFLVQWLKGHALPDAAGFAIGWGGVSAALFSGIGYWRWRRNPACMLPRTSASTAQAQLDE